MIVLTAGIISIIMHHIKLSSSTVQLNQHHEVIRLALPFVLLTLILTALMLIGKLIRRRSISIPTPAMQNITPQLTNHPEKHNRYFQKPASRLFLIHDISPRNIKYPVNLNRPNLSNKFNRYIHKPTTRKILIHDISPRNIKYSVNFNRPNFKTSAEY